MSRPLAASSSVVTPNKSDCRQIAPKKVVLVDDDQFFTRNLERLLRRQGFTVVTVKSAIGLSATMEREQPDLLLLDVTMPSLNGDRAADALRKAGLAKCPIILLSALPKEQLAATAARCQATGFISKVRRAEDILKEIALVLERWEA